MAAMLVLSSGALLAMAETGTNKEKDFDCHQFISDSAAKYQMRLNGIHTESENVSLSGIRLNTLFKLVSLKIASGGYITITAGTESNYEEYGSESHVTGHKVHVSSNSKLDGYIHKFARENKNYFLELVGEDRAMYRDNSLRGEYKWVDQFWDILYHEHGEMDTKKFKK
ncbi:hypothetical protein HELRODRAFT_180754 [Helobdella robusta]|uniref:Uncharacterized protein n=1 Tax=Helobdella robusta TaxID=6412 RepID=T1FG86_HELRO|nr:hypothetical protein HELRODRAFT_180754 [Helobdella robusta]ESN93660.1 hypothetical protein HELRODRAFT_180754 [Helobdella robusta]